MVKKVKVILNPHGGRWNRKTKITKVEQALQSVGLDYQLEVTKEAGHGIQLAQEAVEQNWPIIAAAGGDGTINEVVNGLMRASNGEQVESILALIPIGTANDLASVLSLPKDVTAACQRIVATNTRQIDVGRVNGRYFINNSAVGLEPVMTIAHDEMRFIKGNLRYLAAVLKTITRSQSWQVDLTWDEGDYQGPVTLVSIGNSTRTGGLFYMTPEAVLDDGLLDFVVGREMSRWEMFQFVPRVIKGTHIHHPQVIYQKTTSLSMTISPASPIQADGEVFEKSATQIHYQTLPNRVQVIV